MHSKRVFKVALAGCGTVGSGVGEIVVNRAAELAARTGVRFEIARVLVSDVKRRRSAPFRADVYTDNVQDFLAGDFDMLVEVIGGTAVAKQVVLAALAAGKPVVTANKALLALHGAEVFRTARAAETCVAFEASCAGGLPIVGALLRGLQSNRISTVLGIFNSTCNFVLTGMLDGAMSFAAAVAEAQRCGYAEADPTLDTSGGDTAHKLTILASLALNSNVEFARIARCGIDQLELADLRIAREMGYACKLLGIGRRLSAAPAGQPQRLLLTVRPTLVPARHWLAGLSGTTSGVLVYGDAMKQTFYSGAGAGSLPTASAVVADMIEVATGAAQATFGSLNAYNDQTPAAEYVDPAEVETAHYVRFGFAAQRPDLLAEVDQACRAAGIEPQRTHLSREQSAAVAITAPISPRRLAAALPASAAGLQLTGAPVMLPVLSEPGP